MTHFTSHALESKAVRTESEWRGLVRKNWSMECQFDRAVECRLVSNFWFMGDLRFEIADLSGQQWTWKPGPGLDNWRVDAFVILIVESGVINIEQNGACVSLGEDAMLLFDGSVKYTQSSGHHTRALALRVPKASLEARGRVLFNREMFLPDPSSPDVAMLKSIIGGAAAYGEHCSAHGSKLVAEHLTDMMDVLTDNPAALKRPKSSDVMLRRVKRYIERNVGNEHADLDTVANAMGVSRAYLTKLFERNGTSVMRYLLAQRLERAKKLLTTGGADLRIGDVAWQCGFVSAAHFSRVFKKQYGTTPKAFRQMCEGTTR
jgi:AraC-like DNA-binding protein